MTSTRVYSIHRCRLNVLRIIPTEMGAIVSIGGDRNDTCAPCLPWLARDCLLSNTESIRTSVPVPNDSAGFMCLSDQNLLLLL